MTLVPVDTSNALAVSDYLTRARDWLATAVEKTGPQEIAAAKAEIATAAEATKQLGLSKEIQDDAKEMVRRAEYALGKAIRKAQDEGAMAQRGYNGPSNGGDRAIPVTDLLSRNEWRGSGSESPGVRELSEATEDEFEAAIEVARGEGNLSRANVARIAREKSGKPRAASRRPLPDVARDAGIDLRKAVERLERISGDDRLGQNREQVASHLRGHLSNAVEVCQDLLDRLNNN